MTSVGGVVDQLEREARLGRESENSSAQTFLGPAARGEGGTSKRRVITRTGCSDWPRAPSRPSLDGQKTR